MGRAKSSRSLHKFHSLLGSDFKLYATNAQQRSGRVFPVVPFSARWFPVVPCSGPLRVSERVGSVSKRLLSRTNQTHIQPQPELQLVDVKQTI